MSERILVIEDEAAIAMAIEDALLDAGHEVQILPDCAPARRCIAEWQPRLLVLDRMLPGGDGLDWLSGERRKGMDLPCLILSARGSESERCAGLEGGADDYLPKPFSPRELLARIQALLRRAPEPLERLLLDGCLIDFSARRCGEEELSEREGELLRYLVQHRGRVVAREELLRRVWGMPVGAETRAIDMCLSGLRRKLGEHAACIVTVRGGGYRLDAACEAC